MPCLFDNPYVMNKHMDTCIKIIKLSKKNLEYLFFWGDFNSQPNSIYKMLNENMTSINKDKGRILYIHIIKCLESLKVIDYIFIVKDLIKLKDMNMKI